MVLVSNTTKWTHKGSCLWSTVRHPPRSNMIPLQYSSRLLKRYSFLKRDPTFIYEAVNSERAQFLPYHDFYPFCSSRDRSKLWKLHRSIPSNGAMLKPFIQSHKPGELVFMGLIPPTKGESSSQGPSFTYKKYKGDPLFAIDITRHEYMLPQADGKDSVIKCQDFRHFNDLTVDESSLLSLGKMMLHWLYTHKYCSMCGYKNDVIACGSQLKCTNHECESNGRITNVSFPRTDPVVIVGITNQTRDAVLLCKHKAPSARDPKRNMYACVSGFMDPSETIESAVLREVFEETGLDVLNVEYVTTQPWPFTNNIMIGCLATVDDKQPVDLGHDEELVDASWFPTSQVKQMLNSDMDSYGLLRDPVSGIGLPNDKTIANRLIKAVCQVR